MFSKLTVMGGIFGLIQFSGSLGGQCCRVIVVSTGHKVWICRAKAAVFVKIIQRQPVGKMEPIGPEISSPTALNIHFPDIVHPAFHVFILLCQKCLITIGSVKCPGDYCCGICPGAGTVARIHAHIVGLLILFVQNSVYLAQNIGNHMRNRAFQCVLFQFHII